MSIKTFVCTVAGLAGTSFWEHKKLDVIATEHPIGFHSGLGTCRALPKLDFLSNVVSGDMEFDMLFANSTDSASVPVHNCLHTLGHRK